LDDGENKENGILTVEGGSNGNAALDGEQANRILVISGQNLEYRHELGLQVLLGDLGHKQLEVGSSSTADHRCLVGAELGKQSTKLGLGGIAHAGVNSSEQTASRGTRSEPVTCRHASELNGAEG
jgi:hypothetical protein